MKRWFLDRATAEDRWGSAAVNKVLSQAAAAVRRNVGSSSTEAGDLVGQTEGWRIGAEQVSVAAVLRQIEAGALHHCRHSAHEARVVLQPNSALRLLSFLDAGRLLFVLLGDDQQLQAWAIVDLKPCRASEPHVRAVYEMVQNCPIFSAGWDGGQITGHSELHFFPSGEAVRAAALVQIYRMPLMSADPQQTIDPAEKARHDSLLAEELYTFIMSELGHREVDLLVGHRLVAVDGKQIEDLMDPRETSSRRWSFFDGRARALPWNFTFDWSESEGVLPPARLMVSPPPGVTRSKLAHAMEIMSMPGVTFEMGASVPPYLKREGA